MSDFFQQVVFDPSFTGFGYLPDLTPARNVERPMGNSGSIPRFLSPVICQTLSSASGFWVVGFATLHLLSAVKTWLDVMGNAVLSRHKLKRFFSLSLSF